MIEKNIKEQSAQSPHLHDNYLTKDGKFSPNQSSKYFDKSSINKYEDNFFQDYKKGITNSNPHQKSNIDSHQNKHPTHNKEESQRSIDGQNTPIIQVHEIKKIENNFEIPIMFESYIINRFNNRETFKELFKESFAAGGGAKMQDVAP